MDELNEPRSMLFGALVDHPGAAAEVRSGVPTPSHVAVLIVGVTVASLVAAALA